MLWCPQCGDESRAQGRFCSECGLCLEPLGTYRLLHLVKEGGYGAIYRAINTKTGYPVAVKTLHKHLVESEQIQRRFTREALLLEQIQHPHVVRIFDHGYKEKLGCYLVMEWLEGEDLHQLAHETGFPFAPARLLTIFAQLLDALQAVHLQGIIHRDIKPANIRLLRENDLDVTKLLDFGIAWQEGGENITRTGDATGTPHFMAPEQIEGKRAELGPHTDLYAVGVLLVWMLTGEYLFEGETSQEICFKQCYVAPPTLKQLRPEWDFDPALEALIARAVEKDPRRRFGSTDAFLDGLQAVFARYPERLIQSRGSRSTGESAPLPGETMLDVIREYKPGEQGPICTDPSLRTPAFPAPPPPATPKPERKTAQQLPSPRPVKVEALLEATPPQAPAQPIHTPVQPPQRPQTPQSIAAPEPQDLQVSYEQQQLPDPSLPKELGGTGSLAHRYDKLMEATREARRWFTATVILALLIFAGLGIGLWRAASMRLAHRLPATRNANANTTTPPTTRPKPQSKTQPPRVVSPQKRRSKPPPKAKTLPKAAPQRVASLTRRQATTRPVRQKPRPEPRPLKTKVGQPAPAVRPAKARPFALLPKHNARKRREQAKASYELARLAEKSGRSEDAIQFYRRTIAVEPTHKRAHLHLATLLMQEVQCLQMTTPAAVPRCQKAALHFRAYLGLHPKRSKAHKVQRARRYLQQLTQVKLHIASNPQRAWIYQGTKKLGRTPLHISRPWKSLNALRLVRKGFQSCEFTWHAISHKRIWIPLMDKREVLTNTLAPCRVMHRD